MRTMKTNISSEEYDMVMMSFDFIKNHRDITNDCVPDILLDFWLIPDFNVNARYDLDDARILVFMYILRLYVEKTEIVEKCLSTFSFAILFYHFQVILAATAYSRKTHIPIRPVKIFCINEYLLPNLRKPGQLLREYERIARNRKE